jgi:hypothetical protein
MMQYYRCSSPEDAERLTKVDLVNEGIIPDGLEFVKAQERWAINEGLVGSVMQMNQQTIAGHSTSYTQDFEYSQGQRDTDKTATQVMAEVNSTSALVGSMLNQAYAYAWWQYEEICRRFCIANSKDPDVRGFRAEVLKAGVPEEALSVDCWDIQPERVLGGGNKVLQFAQVDKLMGARALMDPEPQREVLRDAIMVWTDDADRADRLAPLSGKAASDSAHDAELAASTLLRGLPMTLKQGVSHIEYANSLMIAMASEVQSINSRGGMAPLPVILGLLNLAGKDLQGNPTSLNGIAAHIEIVAQDEEQKGVVKQLSDALGVLLNAIKGFAQRLVEQQKRGAEGSKDGPDPETIGKIQAQQITAKAKAANTRESHAERTAQRQVQWEQQMKQSEQEHAQQLKHDAYEHALAVATEQMKLATRATANSMKKPSEGETP